MSLRDLPADNLTAFVDTARAFFLVMSHTALVNCLSVDTYVGSLYNFIAGSNGSRIVPFTQYICNILVANRSEMPSDKIKTTLIAIIQTLSVLLRREPRARYHADFFTLTGSLETLGAHFDGEDPFNAGIILRGVDELRAVVARAHGLLTGETLIGDATHVLEPRSYYPRDVHAPGTRHDNDKKDVAAIEIFPTHEEIMSEEREFLPFADRDQPHFLTDKVERYIDTQFRLLRHDIFGDLKNTLGTLLKRAQDDPRQLTRPQPVPGNVRLNAYTNAFLTFPELGRRGLRCKLVFDQPFSGRQQTKEQLRRKWDESRRLEDGTLLSFMWINDMTVDQLFLVVLDRKLEGKEGADLTSSKVAATIVVQVLAENQRTVQALLGLSYQRTRGTLIEFPHVLPSTFVPVLESLQEMKRQSRLPFLDWILPDHVNGKASTKLHVPPPLYARHPTFFFSLDRILQAGNENIQISPSTCEINHELLTMLEAKTGLDSGQCRAFISALTREYALIQGPPGTGKTFLGVKLMQVLLEAKDRGRLGPIFVVCYTNHALDQFLEHLLKAGIKKVIRLGAQSRSEMLKNHNLREIAQSEGKSRQEGWQVYSAFQALDTAEKRSKMILGSLYGTRKGREWRHFKHHLRAQYTSIHAQFKLVDDEGFEAVGDPFEMWAKGGAETDDSDPGTERAAATLNLKNLIQKANSEVNSLSSLERKTLVEHWSQEIQQSAMEEFYEVLKDAQVARQNLHNVHEEMNRRVMQNADVVGLTTSGLARNVTTLQRVDAKVVICEEAGEVMEPHIVSALLPNVEHFIQIGDHQQLRPLISNFRDLSLESTTGVLHQLDRSQFERLAVGEPGRLSTPTAQLNVQRRMRPEISTLIRETIYPSLRDHPSTLALRSVVGMRQNVFWLTHDYLENEQEADSRIKQSKSNDWEVEMVHALVRHIVRQGEYQSQEIAVLTPYTGQLRKLRAAMRADFEIVLNERDEETLAKEGLTGEDADKETAENRRKPLTKKQLSDLLRIATVDNFQGEEAKIVIVSLVRSNNNSRVGFLKTTNRINVLLSRAQHGMYLIGNAKTYGNIPMWQNVIEMLRASGAVGTSLGLCCPRHPDTPIEVSQAEHFATLSPEGGCREACIDRLPDCGHRCQARCHSEAMHQVFRCEQPCQRRLPRCNHPCQKATCGEECEPCMIKLNGVLLPCGHFVDDLPCHQTQSLDAFKCKVVVPKRVPRCGHEIEERCSVDVTLESFKCPTPCDEVLECGHICPGSCGRCSSRDLMGPFETNHLQCNNICGRRYGTCTHTCRKRCHSGSDCGLCARKCEVACKHSRCTLECHEACAPCIENCSWTCPHKGDCTLPCAAPCNRLPCDERCDKFLPCGHQCPGLCGEDCLPQHCQACKMKLDTAVDMIEFKEYREIDLDDTPIVALACGHFFTAETLDGVIGIAEVYDTDPKTGKISGLKNLSSIMATKIPKCPNCQCQIRQYATQRYNRLINRAVIDEMSKRFVITGQGELRSVESELITVSAQLKESREAMDEVLVQHEAWHQDVKAFERRHYQVKELLKRAARIKRSAAKRHQPAQKLHEAIIAATRCSNATEPLEAALSNLSLDSDPVPVLPGAHADHRIVLGAALLELKITTVLLEDRFLTFERAQKRFKETEQKLKQANLGEDLGTNVSNFFRDCNEFITDSQEKKLPRLCVEGTICFAQIALQFASHSSRATPGEEQHRKVANEYIETSKHLLDGAIDLCIETKFRDADTMLNAVAELKNLLNKQDRYEQVSTEELEAIRNAMTFGKAALRASAWYTCVNGHPFAVGECGMPMQLARCPECGASVGGTNHRPAEGVVALERLG
ncbi:P-loop containing nucleoside triphosphate hydrolase protein [Piedraia hortae CBS 480.64]|uniref:P-loop containing nucleoside triphosphate hydrolase protein n=1 Tax=Piedraia hortae CBS 480.64 TaxID=1314780 RepID=A0A6A7BT63_9PEZI|nr:P-loop containing nucleoside triphosphate hydrolase protein [Piedraia hortae CBS 480.64]